MTPAVQHNIAAFITPVIAIAQTSATAGGTGDNTAITGITIDRNAVSTGSKPLSAIVSVLYDTVMTDTKTLTLKTQKIEHSDDGSTWSDYATFGDVTIAKTGTNTRGATKLAVDLGSAKRYVRFDVTPDLSASGTDTAVIGAAWVFAGFDRLPAA